jgi:hypothetical protein
MFKAGGVFKDHDDSNLIWSRSSQLWVDMQIMSSPWLLPNGSTTICPHNLSDNGPIFHLPYQDNNIIYIIIISAALE